MLLSPLEISAFLLGSARNSTQYKMLSIQYCKAHKKVRPYTALFDQQRSERTVENEEFLDFQYYNIEKPITNMSGYTFPSLCVGYEGLYNAFRHLQLFKQDPNNDSFASYNFSYEYDLNYL